MASNIEKLIEDMENYIDTQSKPAAFSSSKIVINRDELEQYLQELKETTPDEIRRYQKMLANKEAILADARNKALKDVYHFRDNENIPKKFFTSNVAKNSAAEIGLDKASFI